jgi:hypothetical protein
VSSYQDKIAALRERLTDVGKQLISLADKRKSYSLAAAEGDERARQQIADLDFQLDATRREEGTLSSAVEAAQALQRQAEREAEAKQRHEREIEAYQHARAIVALNEEIDLGLKQLREMFERRQAMLVALGNSGACDLGLITRLSHRSGANAAAAYAGLTKYFAMEMTPNSAVRPLSTANEILLKVGQPPAQARVRLGN